MIRLLAASLALLASLAQAGTTVTDPRYCGTPARDASGAIARSDSVPRRFQYLYPCPATRKQYGPCTGWAKDHVIPLAEGGCDSIANMQWLPLSIKSCGGKACKDRWERAVYKRAAP
jgi:hypothetical protein